MTTTATSARALPVGPGRDVSRILVAVSLVDALGTGLVVPLELLFLSSVVGLGLTVSGAALSAMALLALSALPLCGRVIDGFGARRVAVALGLVRGVALLGSVLPVPAAVAVGLLTAVAVADRWAPAAAATLVAALSPDRERRNRTLALVRATRNGAMTAGSLAAALIATGGAAGFRVALALDGLSFLLVSVLVLLVPATRPTAEPESRGARRPVLRDRTFVALTAANTVYALGYTVLVTGLPAYVVTVLGGSPAWGAVVFAVNTGLVAVGQLPSLHWSRGRSARAVTALGGYVFAASFCAYAVLSVFSGAPTAVLGCLVVVTAVYSGGELLHSVGSASLAHDASPEHARGRYLAFFQLSWAAAEVAGPVLFTWLVGGGAAALWLPLAGATVLAALSVDRPSRLRSRRT